MSITLQQQKCPNCGAPLANLRARIVHCGFCSAEFKNSAPLQFQILTPALPAHPPNLGLVTVGDVAYRVHGRLAVGHGSDVFLARRDALLTEMVVLKIARDPEFEFGSEWKLLNELRELTGNPLLLYPIQKGVARCSGRSDRSALVYRWRSGFHWTFESVRTEYPRGVDPRAAVWMWNRLLEQITDLQRIGFSHGNLTPAHLLLHPRDHGLMLCGWSKASRASGQDVAQAAACIGSILGSVSPLHDLVKRAPKYRNAADLKLELKRVAEAAFGPPQFHPFTLSGES